MSDENSIREPAVAYTVPTANLEQPVILEQNGEPVAVLMNMADYGRYQTVLQTERQLTTVDALRAADNALFRDLVGCALSSGDPQFAYAPSPHWRIPYRFLDGTLVTIVEVDAYTGTVALTDSQRDNILSQVEELASQHAYA